MVERLGRRRPRICLLSCPQKGASRVIIPGDGESRKEFALEGLVLPLLSLSLKSKVTREGKREESKRKEGRKERRKEGREEKRKNNPDAAVSLLYLFGLSIPYSLLSSPLFCTDVPCLHPLFYHLG